MSNGTATLQARGGIRGDSEILWALASLGAASEGGSDLEVRSYGARTSLNSTFVDVIAGVDDHRIEDEHATETSFGLRKRFPSTDPGSFYVEAAFRRGHGLETPAGRTHYDGMEAAFGAVFQLGEHWFVDMSLSVEWTLGDLDLESGDDDLNEVLFNLGLGFGL